MNIIRLTALMRKESLQIVRDPAAIAIAFVLPVLLLILFSTAISLDIKQIPIALVQNSTSTRAASLAAAFTGTKYFKVVVVRDKKVVVDPLIASEINGFVEIPGDFDQKLASGDIDGLIHIVTDASQPNTAAFVSNYARLVVSTWVASHVSGVAASPVFITSRVWFNPDVKSKNFLVPGAIGIVMTMIGTLLTALVIAREWERGSMEALLSTPARSAEILVGKMLPYFILGLITTLFAAGLAQWVFNVPMRGSWFALLSLSAAFLLPALAQGLLISTLAKNQFIASVLALLSAFLPAFLLSGFLFEIDSMPTIIQWFTAILAVKYYIIGLQTVFIAGDVWSLFLPNIGFMLLIGTVMMFLAKLKTPTRLE